VTAFQQYQLFHLQCCPQALISEREAMIVANKFRESCGDSLVYGEEAFAMNARAIYALAPDPHQFA
jgi:hypothetical protein